MCCWWRSEHQSRAEEENTSPQRSDAQISEWGIGTSLPSPLPREQEPREDIRVPRASSDALHGFSLKPPDGSLGQAPGVRPAQASFVCSAIQGLRGNFTGCKTAEKPPAHFSFGESCKSYLFLTFRYFKSVSSSEEKPCPEFGAKSKHLSDV